MKKNKGFTLVELLAVIAILAVLVIIALPNVMGMFKTAKRNSFETEVKNIYKVAQQTWVSDSMFDTAEKEYGRCDGCSYQELDLSGRQEIKYYIKINKSGNVVKFVANDGTYQYSYKGNGLDINEIKQEDITAATSSDLQIKEYVYTYGYISSTTTVSSLTPKYNSYQDAINATGRKYFLRCEIEGNNIVEVNLGFTHNSQVYYMKTDGGSLFENNKDFLINTLHLNCNILTNYISCGSNSGTIVVNNNGALTIQSSDYLCGVWGNSGISYCRND